MKFINLILLLTLPFNLFSQDFKTRSTLKDVDETRKLSNVRCAHSAQCEFKKVTKNLAGLSEKALVAKVNDFYIAIDNPGKAYNGRARFQKALVNLKGEKSFVNSPYVIDISNCKHFKKFNIAGKNRILVVDYSSYMKLDGGTAWVSVFPVKQTNLNIGGNNVKVIATSINKNLEFEPEVDKIVIHEKGRGTDYYSGIRVKDIDFDRPFKYGNRGNHGWYKLIYHKEDQSIEVVKTNPSFGYIKSNVNWSMILKPGDMRIGGKANQKVRVPVGEYKLYYWTANFGKFNISEFDHKDWSTEKWVRVWPKISISKDNTIVKTPLNKIKCWYNTGWYKNEFAAVLGFTNAHGAGNMGISYNRKGLKYKYKLIAKESGEVLAQGKMHEG